MWRIKTPNLYAAVTTLEIGGRPVDSYETVFGIRTAKFDAKRIARIFGKNPKR